MDNPIEKSEYKFDAPATMFANTPVLIKGIHSGIQLSGVNNIVETPSHSLQVTISGIRQMNISNVEGSGLYEVKVRREVENSIYLTEKQIEKLCHDALMTEKCPPSPININEGLGENALKWALGQSWQLGDLTPIYAPISQVE